MRLFSKKLVAVSLAISSLAALASAQVANAAPTLNGSGATFPAPVYTKWASDYRGLTNITINYQGTGSSAGIDAIKKGVVDFGGTDAPLSQSELNAANLIQFPTVIGGVVPVYNVNGLSKNLILDGDTLGNIYLGKIVKWNDAAIARLNPGVSLPDTEIRTVRRSDGSGTTFMFTDYLSRVNGGWRSIGANKSPNWNGLTLGGKGNDGVAALVKQLPNSIGYVEYAYAKKNGLKMASLVNRDGKVVSPNAGAFAAAASKANWSSDPSMGISLNNQSGANTWPITGATYVLMPKRSNNGNNTVEVLRFFEWAMVKGQSQASNLDYIPLPVSVYQRVKATVWKSMTDTSGKSII